MAGIGTIKASLDASLDGTGPRDAGRLEGGSYVIEGGFWASASGQTADLIFADSFES